MGVWSLALASGLPQHDLAGLGSRREQPRRPATSLGLGGTAWDSGHGLGQALQMESVYCFISWQWSLPKLMHGSKDTHAFSSGS